MKKNILGDIERKLLMEAIETSHKFGRSKVFCDKCLSIIEINRDGDGKLERSQCSCGKFSSTFR